MNRTKIEWTDFTWNPVTGCLHGCPYCYARAVSKRFGRSFAPQLHSNRLGAPAARKKPAIIFVGSMADLFGDWVDSVWIRAVLEVVRRCPQHTFQFLTKNPERLEEFNPWPKNTWVGATTATEEGYNRAARALPQVVAPVKFISAEPLLFKPKKLHHCIDWLIIGAQTGPGAVRPDRKTVEKFTFLAQCLGIPVFQKDNLGDLVEYKDFPQEKTPCTM